MAVPHPTHTSPLWWAVALLVVLVWGPVGASASASASPSPSPSPIASAFHTPEGVIRAKYLFYPEWKRYLYVVDLGDIGYVDHVHRIVEGRYLFDAPTTSYTGDTWEFFNYQSPKVPTPESATADLRTLLTAKYGNVATDWPVVFAGTPQTSTTRGRTLPGYMQGVGGISMKISPHENLFFRLLRPLDTSQVPTRTKPLDPPPPGRVHNKPLVSTVQLDVSPNTFWSAVYLMDGFDWPWRVLNTKLGVHSSGMNQYEIVFTLWEESLDTFIDELSQRTCRDAVFAPRPGATPLYTMGIRPPTGMVQAWIEPYMHVWRTDWRQQPHIFEAFVRDEWTGFCDCSLPEWTGGPGCATLVCAHDQRPPAQFWPECIWTQHDLCVWQPQDRVPCSNVWQQESTIIEWDDAKGNWTCSCNHPRWTVGIIGFMLRPGEGATTLQEEGIEPRCIEQDCAANMLYCADHLLGDGSGVLPDGVTTATYANMRVDPPLMCNGHGTCRVAPGLWNMAPYEQGGASCACEYPYTGPGCSQCASGRWGYFAGEGCGNNCNTLQGICAGVGICDVDVGCMCKDTNRDPATNCQRCKDGYMVSHFHCGVGSDGELDLNSPSCLCEPANACYDPATEVPCAGHGTCMAHPYNDLISNTCLCDDGWMGTACNIPESGCPHPDRGCKWLHGPTFKTRCDRNRLFLWPPVGQDLDTTFPNIMVSGWVGHIPASNAWHDFPNQVEKGPGVGDVGEPNPNINACASSGWPGATWASAQDWTSGSAHTRAAIIEALRSQPDSSMWLQDDAHTRVGVPYLHLGVGALRPWTRTGDWDLDASNHPPFRGPVLCLRDACQIDVAACQLVQDTTSDCVRNSGLNAVAIQTYLRELTPSAAKQVCVTAGRTLWSLDFSDMYPTDSSRGAWKAFDTGGGYYGTVWASIFNLVGRKFGYIKAAEWLFHNEERCVTYHWSGHTTCFTMRVPNTLTFAATHGRDPGNTGDGRIYDVSFRPNGFSVEYNTAPQRILPTLPDGTTIVLCSTLCRGASQWGPDPDCVRVKA